MEGMLSLHRSMNLAAPEIVRSLEQFCSQKNLNIQTYQNLFNQPEKRSPSLISSPPLTSGVEAEPETSLFKKPKPKNKRQKRDTSENIIVVRLSYEEALKGAQKAVEYESPILCPSCTKENVKPSCRHCGGKHGSFNHKTLILEVEPHTSRGMQKVIKGEGISDDYQRGDLVIEFEVEDHPTIKREGDSGYTTVHLTVFQAVLGCKVSLPKLYAAHPKDKLEVQVESGTQPNSVLRIPHQGYYCHGNRKKRGDLFITIVVDIPKHITKHQKELFERLAAIDSMLNLADVD